ncbi:hypothetical protein Hypma_001422 [Hypsizygus marmoreus]|uniref:Uncharacterized protein n=1 Tax=Hypsizygus marmoreus TaxID=39966 RepID=A0A369KBF5_HYPMA|nr:hypothetical protein Hypma_001422 [Hypsizygus marmoreus]
MLPIPLAFICAIAFSTLLPHTYYDQIDRVGAALKRYWGNRVAFVKYAKGGMDGMVEWPFVRIRLHRRVMVSAQQEEEDPADLRLLSLLDALEDHTRIAHIESCSTTAERVEQPEHHPVVFQTLHAAPPNGQLQPSQHILDAQPDHASRFPLLLVLSAGVVSVFVHWHHYSRQRRVRVSYVEKPLSRMHDTAGPWTLNPAETSVMATSLIPPSLEVPGGISSSSTVLCPTFVVHDAPFSYFGQPLVTAAHDIIPQAINGGMVLATAGLNAESSEVVRDVDGDGELVDEMTITKDDPHVPSALSPLLDLSPTARDAPTALSSGAATAISSGADPISSAILNNNLVLQQRLEKLEARIEAFTTQANANIGPEMDLHMKPSAGLDMTDGQMGGKDGVVGQREADDRDGMPSLTDGEGEDDYEDIRPSSQGLRLYQSPSTNVHAGRMNRHLQVLVVDASSMMDLKSIENLIFLVKNDTLFEEDQFLVVSRRRPRHGLRLLAENLAFVIGR